MQVNNRLHIKNVSLQFKNDGIGKAVEIELSIVSLNQAWPLWIMDDAP